MSCAYYHTEKAMGKKGDGTGFNPGRNELETGTLLADRNQALKGVLFITRKKE